MPNSGWRYGSDDANTSWVGNASTISVDTTIPADFNVVLYGPNGIIKIANGTILTFAAGSVVKIKDIFDV